MSEVERNVDAGERSRHSIAVDEIAGHHVDALPASAGKSTWVAYQAANLVAAFHEAGHQASTDVAGRTRCEHSHGILLSSPLRPV